MASIPKKRAAVDGMVDPARKYSVEEACALVKKAQYAKFDETVDLAIRLGVNPKHADQMVRGAIVLPHGTGRSVRVLVFAKGDKEREAREAGADFAGSDDLVAKVSEGFLDFDRVIATPDMMGSVGKLGRVLGPRGLMPNPKVGTVTADVTKAVKELKAGRVEFRVEKAGIIQTPFGKASFKPEALALNLRALLDQLMKLKPQTSKGTYMRSITISTTHGPGIKIDPTPFTAGAEAQ